jgi:hypothetical protein
MYAFLTQRWLAYSFPQKLIQALIPLPPKYAFWLYILYTNGQSLQFRYFGFQAACQTALSLRLFVLNSLTVYHRFFSSEGYACNILFFLGSVFPLVVFSPTRRFFFCFRGGRPLHNVKHFIFRIPTVDLAICLAISSLVVLLEAFSHSLFRSRFLRYRGRPSPRSFTLFLPSWCVRTFWIPHSALALVRF